MNGRAGVYQNDGQMHLQTVPFQGDVLETAVDEDGRIWASVKRICENLGIDHSRQIRKLRSAHWATVVMMSTVAEDGKAREHAMIDAESVPMWLATINENKVAEQIRSKLRVYQVEARDVLFAHYSRQPARSLQPYGELASALAIAMRPFVDVVKELQSQVVQISKQTNQNAIAFRELAATVKEMQDHAQEWHRVQRQPVSNAVKRKHIRAMKKRGGVCPCCHTRKVLDATGEVTGEFDHFFMRSMASLTETWLVCKHCNARLSTSRRKGENYWHQCLVHFTSYQQFLEITIQDGQLLLPFDGAS